MQELSYLRCTFRTTGAVCVLLSGFKEFKYTSWKCILAMLRRGAKHGMKQTTGT